MLTLVLRGFLCWGRCPFVLGLCLIAEETEQGVTITLLILVNKSTTNNYTEPGPARYYFLNLNLIFLPPETAGKSTIKYYAHPWPGPG